MVAHALTYWPNVGPFGPSLPQPPNLTSLRKLQYTSARTNVMHASIVAHATLFGVLHTFERGWGDGGVQNPYVGRTLMLPTLRVWIDFTLIRWLTLNSLYKWKLLYFFRCSIFQQCSFQLNWLGSSFQSWTGLDLGFFTSSFTSIWNGYEQCK